jgi:hypothetical protein
MVANYAQHVRDHIIPRIGSVKLATKADKRGAGKLRVWASSIRTPCAGATYAI